MKKRIFAILMAVIMVVSLVAGAVPALAAEDGVTIRFHYHREDGQYEGWEMWFWDMDGITSLEPPYQLVDEGNGDVVATIKVKTGTTKVGYIVRYGEWEKKDVEHDQHMNITGVLSGTVDFYVESGVTTQPDSTSIPSREKLEEMKITYAGREQNVMVLGDDVKTGVVVTNTQYKEANRDGYPEVTLQLSSKLADDYNLTESTFVVMGREGAVPLADPITQDDGSVKQSYRVAGQYVYLTLGKALELDQNYSIEFEGRSYAINMPDFFSRDAFEAEFTYEGDDLGQTYTKEKTTLRVWAPTAVSVAVRLYSDGDTTKQTIPDEEIPMTKDVQGTWVVTLDGDMHGKYYTYYVDLHTTQNEAADPYARTTGVNGRRSMIIDLDSTDPEGWADDKNPHAGENFTDAVIWELHVRDLSSDSSSGIKNAGKFLGLIEKGTKTSGGVPTGLDHMVDLGITHVHLLPSYDFSSVDETVLNDPDAKKFNWGYDPMNYNVPEGSYSTDPYKGEVRVSEMKQMVKGLHDAGISVVMDVVYNHVSDANGFCFNKIVPGYFTRPNSNGSGCGNDVATERSMVSKYIVDSVNYWADEYHIDGFRFDLAGLIDTDTINEIMTTVHAKHPDVVFYGEGWAAGSTTLTKNGYALTTMANASKVPGFAFFSDTIRNATKGGTYGGVSKGFISGGNVNVAEMNACYQGLPSWCPTPSQSINYISAHDNNTLFDHISMVTKDVTVADRISMNKLGAAFYITAQGIPFMQAGEEFLRSKPDPKDETGFNENSYNASDEINSLKWSDLEKAEYKDTYEYYKGLIAFRKAHPALRLTNANDSLNNVKAQSGLPANVLAYQVNGGVNGEKADAIFSVFNANANEVSVNLPEGEWTIFVNGEKAGTTALGTASGSVKVGARSAMILVQGDVEEPGQTDPTQATQPGGNDDAGNGIIIALVIAIVVVIAAIVVILIKKNKK